MKKPRSSREAGAQVPAWLHARLKMYCLAASAAGVGTLALTSPAEAKVIYTAANQSITGQVPVDFNNDGIADIILSTFATSRNCTTFACSFSQRLTVSGGSNSNLVWGSRAQSMTYASALPRRILIGNNVQKFSSGNRYENMAGLTALCNTNGKCSHTQSRGRWRNVENRYLGVKFSIAGTTHYGWARLTVSVSGSHGISATLTGYAYETVRDKPIQIAGQGIKPTDPKRDSPEAGAARPPATLGRLAAGQAGLTQWRLQPAAPSK